VFTPSVLTGFEKGSYNINKKENEFWKISVSLEGISVLKFVSSHYTERNEVINDDDDDNEVSFESFTEVNMYNVLPHVMTTCSLKPSSEYIEVRGCTFLRNVGTMLSVSQPRKP
jgi:hypothetical protein